jgi:hypothetical protein
MHQVSFKFIAWCAHLNIKEGALRGFSQPSEVAIHCARCYLPKRNNEANPTCIGLEIVPTNKKPLFVGFVGESSSKQVGCTLSSDNGSQ